MSSNPRSHPITSSLPGTSSFNRLTYIRRIDANTPTPHPVKTKIWQGEAINLASLLAPSVDEDNQNTLLQMDESGNIGLGSSNRKNKIHSLVPWNEAWRIYSFVMQSNQALSPDQKMSLGKGLLQYMDYVNNLYSLQADWQYFDHFSSYKQYNDVPFACFDPELKDKAISRAKNGAGLARNNMSVPGRCGQPPRFTNTTRRQAPSVGSLSGGKVETRKIQYPLWIQQFVSGFYAVL